MPMILAIADIFTPPLMLLLLLLIFSVVIARLVAIYIYI